MVFSSLNFIFVFLPILLVSYYICLKLIPQLRNYILLAASLFFYAYGGLSFLIIMLVSIIINTLFGWLVGVSANELRRKLFMITAVVINLGLLGYYKYTNFAVENLNALFGVSIANPGIVLPIGISFFTFQGMSYVLDLYMNKAEYEKNPLNIALYISSIPQLIAGPIVRFNSIAQELRERRENLKDFSEGIVRFGIGLGKKILIANSIGGNGQ